jgi:hypothetical protein
MKAAFDRPRVSTTVVTSSTTFAVLSWRTIP